MATGYGFECAVGRLVDTSDDQIIGELNRNAARRYTGAVEHAQIRAWEETLRWLRDALSYCMSEIPSARDWHLCLEYEIPRRGGRIDATLIAHDLIFPIEFKASESGLAALRQAEDYGLELADFHEESHHRKIVPILCSGACERWDAGASVTEGTVLPACATSPRDLGVTLASLFKRYSLPETKPIDAQQWLDSDYSPTPTIVEAAMALYAGHGVAAITSSRASADLLNRTQGAVSAVIREASATGGKAICFVTGIPGAGKTLAGLNVIHNMPVETAGAFLSGNGPLVDVLRGALKQDLRSRKGINASEASRRASTLINIVHRWLDEYIDRSPDSWPHEHVIVFDEAQRAWSREHSKRKFQRDQSEAEMMIQVMDRRPDWGVVVALIGGGQEINTGEAGLSEWGKALLKFPHWNIHVAPQLLSGDKTSSISKLYSEVPQSVEARIRTDDDLHLSVSQRYYKARAYTAWVEALLAGDALAAAKVFVDANDYPICITRDLGSARKWLRKHARGLRRSGIVASSGARRLRAHGLDVSARINAADWFLKPRHDVRSSSFLEVVATEFTVQGLELDWVALAWGADLRRTDNDWDFWRFRGSSWVRMRKQEDQAFAVNKYRVLMTRARQGIVFWVPAGSRDDPTRLPELYDPVYDYLKSCGIPELT